MGPLWTPAEPAGFGFTDTISNADGAAAAACVETFSVDGRGTGVDLLEVFLTIGDGAVGSRMAD